MSKVLIIDDEEITRNTFSEVLQQYHFSTFEACDGRSGISMFEREMPDAVLLDLIMPGMDGIETMQEMRKIDPDVPIIFVTAHGHIPTAVEAVKMGAYDFIVKPPDYKMLVLAIDRAVAQLRLKRESAAVGTQLLETEAANRELKREITKRKEMEEALQRYALKMKNLSSRLVDIQETERRHVARELHDEIGQALTGLKFTLETMESLPDGQIRKELKKTHTLVGELMSRVRDMSLSLRPSMLDDLGLLPALLWHFRRYTAQTNIHITFKHSCLDCRFEPEVETAVYRVVQEALTNVARHALTDKAEVLLMFENDALEIYVQDSGKGFDPGAASARGDTAGLSGMRERAELLGGRMTIESAPEAGTSLTVRIPLRERRPQKPSEDA
jgi:signal transduction histidine kinase